MTDEHKWSINVNKMKPKSITTTKYGNSKVIGRNSKKQTITKFDAGIKNYPIVLVKPLSQAILKGDRVIASYSLFSKKQEKDRLSNMLNIPLRDRYKLAYYDLKKRLHVDQPPDDVEAITDIDPDYFNSIDGAIIKSYAIPFKSLKHSINSQLRIKQEIGYRHDCVFNIIINIKREQDIYRKTLKRYKTQVKLLDEFISYDYHKSIACLNDWDILRSAVDSKMLELQYLATKEFTLTSQIIGLDYSYSLQQKYGRFLYYLSPPSWRYKNRYFARSVEIEAKGFDFGCSSEEDKFNVIFEKLKRDCDREFIKPPLYFQQPQDLMEVFLSIEMQNLHHFSHVAGRAPHTLFLNKGIKLFKDIISQESSGILKSIQEIKNIIEFKEEHCRQLKTKFFKILNGLFYKSVGELDVLKLFLHLQFCYEKVFNEKPLNMDLLGIAKALEAFNMELCKRLDTVTGKDIKIAIEQYEHSEREKFRRAKVAAKELRLFARMEQVLIRAFEPSSNKKLEPTPSFTISKLTKNEEQETSATGKLKYESTQRRLSEVEREYLTIFTDWTEKDDPANYVHSTENS